MPKIIRVPCSSANLGAGFDVFGLALKASSENHGPRRFSAYLEIHIMDLPPESKVSLNCKNFCEGEGSEGLSRAVDEKYGVKDGAYAYIS